MVTTLLTSLLFAAMPMSLDGTLALSNTANVAPVHATAPQGFIGGGDKRDPAPGGPVPEPATLLLIGSGAVGVGLYSRRRKNREQKSDE